MAFVGLPTARADVSIAEGDFWEYEVEGTIGDIFDSKGSILFEVAGTTTIGDTEMFEVRVTGNSTGTMDLEDSSINATAEFNGYEYRTLGEYDLAETSMIVSMVLEIPILDLNLSFPFGIESVYSDPIDNYIGDDELASDTEVNSSATIDSDMWMDMSDLIDLDPNATNETFSTSSMYNITMTVEEIGVEIETPAGEFICVQLAVEIEVDNETIKQKWYYNDEVKNYVKMTGEDVLGLGVSSVELTDYEVKSPGILSNPYVLGLVVLVAIIVVAVVISQMRKRKTAPELPGLDMDIIRETSPKESVSSEKPEGPEAPPPP